MAKAKRFLSSLWSFLRHPRRNPAQPGGRKRVWRAGRSLPLSVELLETRVVPSATVFTDKADYHPEETVSIFGDGYDAGSALTMQVIRPDGSIVHGDGSFT